MPLSEALDLPHDLGMNCFVLHAFRCNYLFYGSTLFELFMGMHGVVRRDFDNVAGVTLSRSLLVDSDEWGESGCRCGVQQASLRRGIGGGSYRRRGERCPNLRERLGCLFGRIRITSFILADPLLSCRIQVDVWVVRRGFRVDGEFARI